MGSILIAMPKYEDSEHIEELLVSRGLPGDFEICRTASEVLQISNARDYGVVICTKVFKDMSAAELIEYLPRYFGMIILTKDPALDLYSEKTVKLMMPFKPQELVSTVEMLNALFVRQIKKSVTTPGRRNILQEKAISAAKAVLMERNGMTEPEAYRYIQKCSMDTGRSMAESAQMILILNE